MVLLGRPRHSIHCNMRTHFPKGTSLLETVLYIGLVVLTLPTLTVFLLHMQVQHVLFDTRTRMEQTAALTFSELQTTLTAADAITTSTSTLDVNPSILRFQDASGTTIVIDCPTVSVAFPSGTQNVRRLRMQTGANPAIYLTDGDIDVTTWQVSTVKNSTNVVTGLRISTGFSMLGKVNGIARGITFSDDTTFSLSPHTITN